MDLALGIVAGIAALACVWLLVGRASLHARAAAATATADAADSEKSRLATELAAAQTKLDEAGHRNQQLSEKLIRLEEELESAAQHHRSELQQAQQVMSAHLKALEQRERDLKERFAALDTRVSETFKGLAADALKTSSAEFLKLAKESLAAEQTKARADIERGKLAVESLLTPIAETLKKTDDKLNALDKSSAQSAAGITEQLRAAADASRLLRDETGKLVRALREPRVRGRYGELQLRRVAELAGMSAYCDFNEQSSTQDGEGNALRPDMVVRLPSERVVVVDAKTNIQSYLDALHAATPAESEVCLERFAKHVADQAAALARKRYWSLYDGSPEFVVMFIPGDQFIDAALARQPDLLEAAARQNVLLAGPATLIGLLRAVAVGYREQRLADEARELRNLGVEFHERAAIAFQNVAELGAALDRTVTKYNAFIASYESRLEPTLKKFEASGVRSSKDLPEVPQVQTALREIEAKPPLFAEKN
jgi:DNA recombination protein RmuC